MNFGFDNVKTVYDEDEPFNDEFYAHHWFEKTLSSPTG